MRRALTLFLVVAGLVLSTGVAFADQVYHSQHLNLTPIGGDPLRSGFVENIHLNSSQLNPNSPQLYAHEVYVLNGAAPETTYQVTLQVYAYSPTCTGTPALMPSIAFTTNGAGNGKGEKVFTLADIPGAFRGDTHGVRWLFTNTTADPDHDAYLSDCSAVTLD